MINAQATCTGSGCSAPTIDLSDVGVDEGGFVTGGSYTYTATCGGETDCADTALGTITVVPRCEVDLIGVTFECGTPAQIEAQIKDENSAPCGDCDTTPAFQFPVWPLRADGSGNVANGVYQYTVTCNAGGLEGCNSSALGEVVVECQLPCPCVATAKDVTVCAGLVTLDQLKANYLPGNVSCKSTIGAYCDITAEINTSGVTVDANGFVTGGTYKAICQPTGDCLPVEATGKVTTKICNPCTSCEASAPGFTFCEGTVTLAQLQGMIFAQADCIGTGCDQAPLINTAGVTVANGFVTGGSYTATCGAGTNCADTATGTITVTPRCKASAPSFTFCEGTVTLVQLTDMIKARATCTGSGCSAPTIDLSDVGVDEGGFVTGGSYTATCGAGTVCEDTASGIITVVPRCEVDLIGVTFKCGTPAQIEAQIKEDNSAPCGDCDTTPAFQFPVWPLKADGSGNVANGVYQYTVTCNAGGLAGCDSSAIGEVVVDCQLPCPCVATAKDVTVCAGMVTLDELEENYLPGNVSCISTIGAFCDITAKINMDNVTKDANGFVTGGTYKAICQPDDDCTAVEATGKVTTKPCNICTSCEANAPGFRFCEGTVTLAQLTNMIKAQATCTGSGCSAPTIDLSDVEVDEGGFVTGGSYTATCGAGTVCEDTASGTITVVQRCEVDPVSMASCGTPAQIEAQIRTDNSAPCGDCDSTPAFQFPVWPLRADGSGKVANGEYLFTITCNAGGLAGCDSSAMGEVIVDCQEPCPCVATAKDVTVCAGAVTIDQLEDIYLPGNVSCRSTIGALCDITAEINVDNVTKDANGFVTGGTYKAICQPDDDCLPVEATGRVTTKPCIICTCEAIAPDICVPYICTRTTCHQYTLDEIKNEIKANNGGCSTGCTMTLKFYKDGVETPFNNLKWNGVYHYTYKVTCTKGTCVDTDTGKLDVLKLIDCSCTTCNCG
jgi:hypothetical protein